MPVVADKSTHFVIRLINRGCTNRPFYHIGVQKNRRPNLSKVEDQLGVYDPMVNIKGERIMTLDFDRLRKWLKRGAKLSRSMEQFLGNCNFFVCWTRPNCKLFFAGNNLNQVDFI